ncbi:MAG: hypothetical protein AMS14_07200 [Planctomycetes bacterium DG_20]|nr:MAG: hypothetical protein AMS14_07200 [Planctomycetes bacterium DG_20]
MIDPRLAAVALCRVVAFVAFILAGCVGLAALWGKPALALLCFMWGRLVPDLSGRDWATVVLAASVAGGVFIVLSVPGLVLLLLQSVGK